MSLAACDWLHTSCCALERKTERRRRFLFLIEKKDLFKKKKPKWWWVSEKTGNISKQRETAKRFKSEREVEQRPPWERRSRLNGKELIYSSRVEKEQRRDLWCFSISTLTMKTITSYIETGMNGPSLSHYVAIIITETIFDSIHCTLLIWVLIANWSPESNLSDNFPHKSFSNISIHPTFCINRRSRSKSTHVLNVLSILFEVSVVYMLYALPSFT